MIRLISFADASVQDQATARPHCRNETDDTEPAEIEGCGFRSPLHPSNDLVVLQHIAGVTPNTFLSNPPTLSLENLLGDKGLVGPVAEKGINEQFERLVSEGFFQYVVNSNIREEERPIVWNSGLTAAG